MVALSAVACGTDAWDDLVVQTGAVTVATLEQLGKGEVVPGSYIVAFRAPSGSAGLRFASYLSESLYHRAYLTESYLADPRVKGLRYITTVDLANPKVATADDDFLPPPALRLAWTEDRLDDVSAALVRVDFDGPAAAQDVLKGWEANGDLWFAEPNYVNTLMDNPYTEALTAKYTAENLHWHKSIKLTEALTALSKKEGLSTVQAPVIAVLDSGVDVENPGLQGRIWQNPSPGQSGCGDDKYGCDTTVAVKDVLGSGLVAPYRTTGYQQDCPYPGSSVPDEKAERSTCGHGTHVAGIIAANVGGGVGGVCPVCQIMVIKIITAIGGKGVASDDAILGGFKYLTLFGTTQKIVRVANSSFGKYVRSRSVALLVSVLKKKPFELLVVGAAGNDDSMARGYPAALNDAIAVSSVANTDAKAGYSNFGPWVDVAAPGGATQIDGGIVSTVPGTVPEPKNGTSMAAPVVAGVAGLILSVDPTRSFTTLRNSIIDTADCRLYAAEVNNGINRNLYYPKPQGENAHRPLLGSGIVDAAAAIENKLRNDCAGAQVRRVSRQCGVVGEDPRGAAASGALLLVPLLGVVYVLTRRRTRVARQALTLGEGGS